MGAYKSHSQETPGPCSSRVTNPQATDKVIGATMRVLRQNVGLTQRELAEALHTTQAIVSGIESGRRCMRLREAIAYSRCMGMSPARLVRTVHDVLVNVDLMDR